MHLLTHSYLSTHHLVIEFLLHTEFLLYTYGASSGVLIDVPSSQVAYHQG